MLFGFTTVTVVSTINPATLPPFVLNTKNTRHSSSHPLALWYVSFVADREVLHSLPLFDDDSDYSVAQTQCGTDTSHPSTLHLSFGCQHKGFLPVVIFAPGALGCDYSNISNGVPPVEDIGRQVSNAAKPTVSVDEPLSRSGL